MSIHGPYTPNRFTLFRTCHTCGKKIVTTRDTPFMRQLCNVDGKKQKTCYFCSERCKAASYIHKFDGKAADRKKARDAARDNAARWQRYYAKSGDKVRQHRRDVWNAMTLEERRAEKAFYEKKRKLKEAGTDG